MPFSEFRAVIDLLAMLLLDWRIGILTLALVAAAVSDYRSHRIPNWLVVSGAAFALIYNTVFPPFLHHNALFPLAGLALGLLLFLPLYFIRVMGAGDVKLLAMVGTFLGPEETFYVALATMIVGGALAITFVLARGTATRMFYNLVSLFQVGFLSVIGGSKPNLQIDPRISAGKLPYGVAIAIGTLGYLVLHQLGLL